jgi:hypothetical protein
MYWQPSETVDFSKLDYDLVFTSPPYFMIEEYKGMKSYEGKKNFIDTFFVPVVKSAYAHLPAGGTLALNATTLTVGTLHITGNSILDFGNSTASVLNATTFVIDAGVTLTITNWANGVDYFFATNWTGATANVRGAAPMNQVAFTGFSAASTAWQSYDQQITPVPEPSTYGALLIAFAGAVTLWRRARSRPAAA